MQALAPDRVVYCGTASKSLAPGAEHDAITRAQEHGLALSGLRGHAAGDEDDTDAAVRAGLVIGYARPAEHAYTTALARLCAVLSS
jgi:GntR family transcriptional regulator/MocR family aminotransferase